MILKVRPMTTEHWTYVDDIASVHVWRTRSADPDIWDDADAYNITVVPLQTTRLDEQNAIDVVVVDATMRTAGKMVRYVLPAGGFAYLMNDEGRTIERL